MGQKKIIINCKNGAQTLEKGNMRRVRESCLRN